MQALFSYFLQFFKSLILQTLWIYSFCDFTRYLVFWLYFGCRDFPHFLQTQGHKKVPSFRQIWYFHKRKVQRRSWTGINLEIPDNIYWRIRKRLCTMGKGVPVEAVETILIPAKSHIVIPSPNRTGERLSCDYISSIRQIRS